MQRSPCWLRKHSPWPHPPPSRGIRGLLRGLQGFLVDAAYAYALTSLNIGPTTRLCVRASLRMLENEVVGRRPFLVNEEFFGSPHGGRPGCARIFYMYLEDFCKHGVRACMLKGTKRANPVCRLAMQGDSRERGALAGAPSISDLGIDVTTR